MGIEIARITKSKRFVVIYEIEIINQTLLIARKQQIPLVYEFEDIIPETEAAAN